MRHKNKKLNTGDCLIFPRFIPRTGPDKDLRGLAELLLSTQAHAKESDGSAFSFVRGSTVSSWDGALNQAHRCSDIDLIVADGGGNYVRKFEQLMPGRSGEIRIAMDVRHVNLGMLEREYAGTGFKGVKRCMELTHDSHPLTNPAAYAHYRQNALLTFLRIGLGDFGSPSTMTPSGAMAAINQGKLRINPLRWWSIQYAFMDSTTARQNVARYYEDVERMMYDTFNRSGSAGAEDLYRVPNGLALGNLDVLGASAGFFMGRILEKLHSKPMISSNDWGKIGNKLRSLVSGVFNGKHDIYSIFRDSENDIEHARDRLRTRAGGGSV